MPQSGEGAAITGDKRNIFPAGSRRKEGERQIEGLCWLRRLLAAAERGGMVLRACSAISRQGPLGDRGRMLGALGAVAGALEGGHMFREGSAQPEMLPPSLPAAGLSAEGLSLQGKEVAQWSHVFRRFNISDASCGGCLNEIGVPCQIGWQRLLQNLMSGQKGKSGAGHYSMVKMKISLRSSHSVHVLSLHISSGSCLFLQQCGEARAHPPVSSNYQAVGPGLLRHPWQSSSDIGEKKG